LSIEPRYYYNLNKRLRKGSIAKKNSGGLIYSIYNPNQTLYSNSRNIDYVSVCHSSQNGEIKRTYNNHLLAGNKFFGLGPNFYLKTLMEKKGRDLLSSLGLRMRLYLLKFYFVNSNFLPVNRKKKSFIVAVIFSAVALL
jgi:hypothetical protein